MSDQRRRRRTTQWLSVTIILSALGAGSSDADTTNASSRVFRCQTNRQIVFSDQPCGSPKDTTEITVVPSNTYRNLDVAPTPAKASRSRKSQISQSSELNNSIAAEQLRDKQRCQRLSDQLDTIQAKMRAGYTAQQGERLHERRRQLEQQRRTERCR